MSSASAAETTASGSTSQKSAIFSRMPCDSVSSERATMMSGWIPISRSSATECWVGLVFELSDDPDQGHQGDVDVQHVLPAHVLAELADGLEEREALDVADRAADLGDEHVHLGELGEAVYAALDLVGDVRDDLHGAAEVVAATLLGDDAVVDAARGDVGVALDELVEEPLVVAEVQVGLGAVLGDEHLTVLERAHGAGVHVDVRVELLARDLEPALLEEPADGRCRDALTEPADDAAGDEDVLGHAPCALLVWTPPS